MAFLHVGGRPIPRLHTVEEVAGVVLVQLPVTLLHRARDRLAAGPRVLELAATFRDDLEAAQVGVHGPKGPTELDLAPLERRAAAGLEGAEDQEHPGRHL